MVVAFCAYYFYDGFVAYPVKNITAARDALNPRPDELPPIVPGMNSKQAETVQSGDEIAVVIGRLGEPGWHSEEDYRWFGPSGYLRVETERSVVQRVEWVRGEFDTMVQFLIGAILGVMALPMVYSLVRIWSLRITLDDAGLAMGGRTAIAIDAMESFNADVYLKKGWITLDYTDGGKGRSVKLDCYVIDKFRLIVGAICDAKGWPDPLPPPPAEED